MSMLEVPGSFTMLIADGWSATVSDGTYELTRGGEDGAIHISTFDRRAGAIADDEAGRVLVGFIQTAGAAELPEIRVLRESRSQHRAVARFEVAGEEGLRAWLAFAVLWPERLVLCSFNGRPGARGIDEAEQMFASIHPPKKGLFRRR